MQGVRRRVHRSRRRHAQPAIEYLLTYSWAILLLALLIAVLYFFVLAPSSIVPSSCSITSGAYCKELIVGSNSVSSKVAILLSNSQPYMLLNPHITLNISSIGLITGGCVPNNVSAGGAIICTVSVPQKALALGTFVNGKILLTATPCPSGNASACEANSQQTYTGSFTTHSSALLSSTSVSLTATASSPWPANGAKDTITVHITMLGYPLSGATVDLSSNSSAATIYPATTTTDSSGNAYSDISTLVSGKVRLSASFANYTQNMTINFTTPIYITFQTSPMAGTSGAILAVDGVQYLYSQLPYTGSYQFNSQHTYAFQNLVNGNANVRYVFSAIQGCGVSAINGTVTAAHNCTITANYKTQYFLSMQTSPPTTNAQLYPGSEWLYSGSQVAIGIVAPPGYKFKDWIGTGSINYIGTSQNANVIMDTPITETAYIKQITSTTSTTSSTSSTSTSTSTSSTSTSTSTSTVATTITNSPTSITHITNSPTSITHITNSPTSITHITNSPTSITSITNSPTSVTNTATVLYCPCGSCKTATCTCPSTCPAAADSSCPGVGAECKSAATTITNAPTTITNSPTPVACKSGDHFVNNDCNTYECPVFGINCFTEYNCVNGASITCTTSSGTDTCSPPGCEEG